MHSTLMLDNNSGNYICHEMVFRSKADLLSLVEERLLVFQRVQKFNYLRISCNYNLEVCKTGFLYC